MGDPKGFLKTRRALPVRQAPAERVQHWREFYEPAPETQLRAQGARCMDCGVPFCQSDSGCPVQNVIPDWNDLARRGRWREAADLLHSTNNFPELTGRLCPAPCETACVLSLIDQPVTIRNIEQAIADRAYDEGWTAPRPPLRELRTRVAVIGSGPSGLAAAQQLRRRGHRVTVFERSDRAGGLLRYGIPEFKLEKVILDRRLAQIEAEGVTMRTGIDVGVDITVPELRREFDAIVLAVGAPTPRDLRVPGRALRGVHFAMEFLTQQNRRLAGDVIDPAREISARKKHVVIIGGGDTGSDCAGTCGRQGATSVRQFELLPCPPEQRSPTTPWPLWPMQLRTSHAHEEGCERAWSTATTKLSGEDGVIQRLHTVRVEALSSDDGTTRFVPVVGTEQEIVADLVLVAAGFVSAEDGPLVRGLGLRMRNGVVESRSHATNVDGVFVAGDARRGASLIVWAIREGRDAADAVHAYLANGAAIATSTSSFATPLVPNPLAT